MIINNIYQDERLKYPLTNEEYSLIEDVWDFVNLFNKQYLFITDYRRATIKHVRKKYDPQTFFKLESILNKMFWNLRWLVYPFWLDPNLTDESEYQKMLKEKSIPKALLLCDHQKYTDQNDLEKKLDNNPIFNSTYYRSFINKLIIVDQKDKVIMTKMMEGASHIFSKNYFNLMTMVILRSREQYERVMHNSARIKTMKIDLPEHYYQYDYAFPNLNYCCYWFGTDEQRLDRINKMYFTKESPKAKYWFKLIQ